MKHNIFVAALGSALLFLGACSEGQYWDEPSDFGSNPVFIKAAQTMTINVNDEIPSTVTVTLSRPEAGAALTIPVTVTPADNASAQIFSGPEEITFEAGSYSVEYPITVVPENFTLGENYTVSLELAKPEEALVQRPAGNYKFTLKMMQDYTWVDAGEAMCESAWVDNIEDPIPVPVQEAVEYAEAGQRLFRLVSPYYEMEPEAAEEGYNIQFITTTSGEAVTLPGWQEIGEEYQGMWFYLGIGYPGRSFFNEDTEYTIAGLMAYTDGREGEELHAYAYEIFIFDWTCPGQ